jgi:hypothetical protein
MKIKFAHVFGCQEKFWLQLSKITAEVERHEEREALATGWLRDEGVWYQCRSTRLCVQDFKAAKPWPNNYHFCVGALEWFDMKALENVYQAYITHKNYESYCNPMEYDLTSASFGVVTRGTVPVAFTKFNHYEGGIESVQFCWDYSEPRVSLGIAIQAREIEYAASLGHDYLYLGPGYEKGCGYKSRYPGFEWWTGAEWSRDVDKYLMLCDRDSDIKSINDLKDIGKLCTMEV